MSVPTSLGPRHQQRLKWFAERAGQSTFYPEPLEDGSLVVSRPKGIYKPADLEHAVSVRIHLQSPYSDGKVRDRPDGSWFFDYHQENPNPEMRDREYTNLGLMACIHDAVPVGVLRERRVPKGARTEYDVLGLAVPVGWRDGYFFFESLAGQQNDRGDTAAEVLTTAAEELEEEATNGQPPNDDYDARRRVYRQIVARRGQRRFRRLLVSAYDSTCAITGTKGDYVLDAAHLRPYRGPDSNVATNGLLLRTDIHTLLDLQLIAIEPTTRMVVVSSVLRNSQYSHLASRVLREPKHASERPSGEVLSSVLAAFHAAEAMRS